MAGFCPWITPRQILILADMCEKYKDDVLKEIDKEAFLDFKTQIDMEAKVKRKIYSGGAMKFYVLFLIILMCGCATFKLESPTGWKVEYSRFWDQELSGVYFSMDKNGTVDGGMEKQKSESDKMLELLLQNLVKGAK